MEQLKAVLTWVAQNAWRMTVTVVGFVLLLAGIVFMVLPGPGIPLILAGLAVLGTQYAWARRALDETKRRATGMRDRVFKRKRRSR